MRKVVFLSALLLCASASSFSQEAIGLRLSNYSGANGILLNPASFVGTPLKWDFNIVAVDVFAENDYVYLQNESLISLIKRNNSSTTSTEGVTDENEVTVGYFTQLTDEKPISGYVNVHLQGPSLVLQNGNFSYGFTTGFRSVSSANDVHFVLGPENFADLEEGFPVGVSDFRAASLSWTELGLHLGAKVLENNRGKLTAGANVKFLLGHQAAYFENHVTTTLVKHADHTSWTGIDIDLAYSTNLAETNNGFDIGNSGKGVGVDLGVMYEMQPKWKSDLPYAWKFGASIVDFGSIRFNNNAEVYNFQNDGEVIFDDDAFNNVENLDDVAAVVNDAVNGTTTPTDDLKMRLPAALSVQVDRALPKNFYISALTVRRIKFKAPGVDRANILAITPRYERRWFEVATPVVLYDDKDLRLGASIKLAFLTIGSVNVLSIFWKHNFSGSDIYVALKLNPFLNRSKSGSGKKGKFGKNQTGCPYMRG